MIKFPDVGIFILNPMTRRKYLPWWLENLYYSGTYDQNYYRPHPKDGEGIIFSLSVHTSRGGVPTFPGGGGTYLPVGGDTYLPRSGQGGYLPSRWGAGGTYPHQSRYPPTHVGTPPHQGRYPPPPHWNSMACACYAVGGMPLAFTQEDFLVDWLLDMPITRCQVIGRLKKIGL